MHEQGFAELHTFGLAADMNGGRCRKILLPGPRPVGWSRSAACLARFFERRLGGWLSAQAGPWRLFRCPGDQGPVSLRRRM